jgi:hypothetical protein
MNGWNVFTRPITLISSVSRKVATSPAISVKLPCEMPALPITMSGAPCFATKSAAAAVTAAASVTSQA